MTKNGTVAQFPSMEDFRSMSETDNEKGPELPTGNWTVTPQALAQLYVEKHEQMHQVKIGNWNEHFNRLTIWSLGLEQQGHVRHQ